MLNAFHAANIQANEFQFHNVTCRPRLVIIRFGDFGVCFLSKMYRLQDSVYVCFGCCLCVCIAVFISLIVYILGR